MSPDISARIVRSGEECAQLLTQGWLALTPNQQWVRELHTELMDKAGVVPSAMSVARWVEVLWQQLTLSGAAPFSDIGIVSARQEQALWHRVMQQDDTLEPRGRSSLAQLALDAWDRSVLYETQLQPLPDFPVLDRLIGWVEQFRQLCREHGLISRSEAMQLLAEQAEAGTALHWPGILLYGFAPTSGEQLGPEPTPLLQKLLQRFADEVALHSFGEDGPSAAEPSIASGPVTLYRADNLDHELAGAASWARQNPGAKMQIIVPNLAQHLERVRRILGEYLGDAESGQADCRWALRLGTPVAALPVFQHFTTWLELATQPLPAERTLSMLRSALLCGGIGLDSSQQTEIFAWLESRLRRQLSLQYDGAGLQQRLAQLAASGKLSAEQKQWLNQLHKALQRLLQLPHQLPVADWARAFYRELRAMGALGDDATNLSVRQALTDLLEQMEGLDAVLPPEPVDLREALFWLRWLATDARLPSAASDADIWVGSGLDARPVPVDATWIVSFDADTWPRVTGGNPLLPARWQTEKAMPGADPQHSYDFSRHLFRRLVCRSKEVMLSLSPATGADVYEPSPLLGELRCHRAEEMPLWRRDTDLRLQEIVDANVGPPPWAPQEKLQTSYVHTMQLMLTDPLAAFVSARLGGQALETVAQQVNARTIGSLIHRAMQQLLPADTELSAKQYTKILQGDLLEQILERELAGTPEHLRQPSLQLVKECILGWTGYEQLRPASGGKVTHAELPLQGTDDFGIPWSIRIDRVDADKSSEIALIDYKSGQPAAAQLNKTLGGNGIQLLVYALAYREKTGQLPSSLLYAWLDRRGGRPQYSGIADEHRSVFGAKLSGKSRRIASVDDIAELIADRERELNLLREGFARGDLADGAAGSGERDEFLLLRPQQKSA